MYIITHFKDLGSHLLVIYIYIYIYSEHLTEAAASQLNMKQQLEMNQKVKMFPHLIPPRHIYIYYI